MDDKLEFKSSVQQAIEIAGGQSALAKKVGVKQPTVFKWLKRGIIPAGKVLKVEQITGVTRHQLNPIIYPVD